MTAVGHASARPALKAAQTLRKGSGGKSRAWLAANHLGGKFTRESWVAYRRAMQDHSERARYEQIGRLMRLRGRSNLARKKRRRLDSERPSGWMRSTLRRMREGCKRARQAWGSKAAMLQLAEAARQGWAQDWAAAVRKHRARVKQRQEEGFEEAQKLAAHGRRSEPIAKSLFPSQAGALFREPDVAQRMHMWSWVFPVAHRVLERMGRDCRGLSGDRVLEWQRLHTTITAGPKVSRPTRAEQRQAACRAAAVGVDTRAGAEKPTASQVAASLRERLVAFAGIRRGVKVALCPRAAKLEQGHLIIRCVVEKADALAESIWHHVSHCFWAPRVQPTLMRLCLLELSEGLARLEPMHAAGEKLRTFWWQDLVGLAGSICAEAPTAQAVTVEYWQVCQAMAGRSCHRQEVHAVRWPSFPSAVAWRSGMEPLKLDDEGAEGDEDTCEEGVLHEIELEHDSEAIAEESDGATQARPLTGPGIAAPSPRASAPPSGDRPEPDLARQWITTAQRARRGHKVQIQGGP